MIVLYFLLTLCSSSLQLSSAFDGVKKCQEICSGGSCCETVLGDFKCCDFVNGVCCSGGISCCPQGSQCTADGLTCKYSTGYLAARPLLELNQKQPILTPIKSTDRIDHVICPDRISVCSENSTCCSMGNQTWGCCNMPNAVCCGDSLHCCPQHTTCNRVKGSCDPLETTLPGTVTDPTVPFWPRLASSRASASTLGLSAPLDTQRMSYDGVQCSGSLECPLHTTCCRNATGQFACCPMPGAVCCSDGEHCCPAGFRCDLSSQRCEKNTPVLPKAEEVLCPDKSFRCSSTSTCCPLPNQEWACCPFENAVCCSDMLHCCPANTTCDVEHGQCLPIPANVQSLNTIKSESSPQTCSSGLISCPGGTCCKNVFGMDACCPHSEAVCCNNGRCCPKGTRCDDSTNECLPSDSMSIPWVRKVSARQQMPFPLKHTDNLCPDQISVCPEDQTCCRLIDDAFGCCPLANGTCCADRRHCCPAGSVCSSDNTCVRELVQPSSKPTIKAERMVSVVDNSPVHSAHWPEHIQPKSNVNAYFCGLCANEWLCCPDATGQPNRKCCPAPGRVCCPDGEHCCPKGTTCVAGGLCAPFDHHREISSSVLLGPSKIVGQPKAQFLDHHLIKSDHWPALMAFRARINVLYLLPSYNLTDSDQYTVCPDRQRYCELNQKCCASSQHGYVCVPNDATCCYSALDTWCPADWYCSDGRSCKQQLPGGN